MARSSLLNTISRTASRGAYKLVGKADLKRLDLSPNTKLYVPKTQKRITKSTPVIKASDLKRIAQARGAKRDKEIERAVSKIASADKTATKQQVARLRRRDARLESALRTIVREDGTIVRVRFAGTNLAAARQYRDAMSLAYRNEPQPLAEWRRAHPDGLTDVYGHDRDFLTSKAKHRRAQNQLTASARGRLAKYYEQEGAA